LLLKPNRSILPFIPIINGATLDRNVAAGHWVPRVVRADRTSITLAQRVEDYGKQPMVVRSGHAVTDGKISSSSIGAVAVAETNPDIVYIGGGETQLRGSITQGDGVYKTTDGGKTWRHLGSQRNTSNLAHSRSSYQS
jgi:hypothetical protein